MSAGSSPVPGLDELIGRTVSGAHALLDAAARHAPAQLSCAVCLWCEFLDAELDNTIRHPVSPAATTVSGTALCALHMEDFQQTRDPFTAAASIVGIYNPKAFPRGPRRT